MKFNLYSWLHSWSPNVGADTMDPWDSCGGPTIGSLHIEQLLFNSDFQQLFPNHSVGLDHQIEWSPNSQDITSND